jgi:hypothetical protein
MTGAFAMSSRRNPSRPTDRASLDRMPDSALADLLTETAERLVNATDGNFVEGDDVVREAGREAGDPAVYHAFREVERRGTLRLEAWGGDMGLPHMIALPR